MVMIEENTRLGGLEVLLCCHYPDSVKAAIGSIDALRPSGR